MAKKFTVNNLTIYEQGSGERAVIILHGYGANGRDLMSLSALFPDRRSLFPEGPHILDQFFIDAHAWFNINLDNLTFNHEEFNESALQLVQAIKELKINPTKSVIGGFSQGAMMALEVARLMEEPFAGVALFSTTPTNNHTYQGKKLRFFQSHGRHDSLLPFDRAKSLYNSLTEAGWQGKFVDFPGEHEIPDEVLTAFQEFVNVS